MSMRWIALPALMVMLVSASPAIGKDKSVEVFDDGFSPIAVHIQQGANVIFEFSGANQGSHSIVSDFFGSIPIPPGGTYTAQVMAAGKFTVWEDSRSGPSMSVKVPIYASPPTGGVTTTFTITWSAGVWSFFVYDVQVMYPGLDSWDNWRRHTSEIAQPFTPDHGVGTYLWRARTRIPHSMTTSDWSRPASILVQP
jgi:hypothetical protein